MLVCIGYWPPGSRFIANIGGTDIKAVDTSRVKALSLLLWQYFVAKKSWAYIRLRVSDRIFTLIPYKKRYTLRLSAIAVI